MTDVSELKQASEPRVRPKRSADAIDGKEASLSLHLAELVAVAGAMAATRHLDDGRPVPVWADGKVTYIEPGSE